MSELYIYQNARCIDKNSLCKFIFILQSIVLTVASRYFFSWFIARHSQMPSLGAA